MSKTIPNYLRIHRVPTRPSVAAVTSSSDSVDRFWEAYREATGWRIDPSDSKSQAQLRLLPGRVIDPMAGAESDAMPSIGHQDALRLAESAANLADQLREAQQAIRRQEAELAARAAIITGQETRERLADRLEATLADVVAASGFDAAAVYLLDDDTKFLTMRSAYGLPADRLSQQPRRLRGSRGDLEALVQGVIAIEELNCGGIDTWNAPESMPAGICAAISHDEVPIGTLWLFSKQPRQIGSRESASAKIAAAQIALQLAHVASAEMRQNRKQETNLTRDIGLWQWESLPVGMPLAESWQVDGTIESPRDWAIGWHTWDVLPDGSLMLAIAEANDPTVRGALAAAVTRAALVAHCGYRHTPRQLMQRIHDTLWQISSGQQLVSLLYARVDPETGEGEVASAGTVNAIIASRHGYRPLVDGHGRPLTSDIEPSLDAKTFQLAAGETLLAYGQGVIGDGVDQHVLGESIRMCMEQADPNPLAHIRREMAKLPLQRERGLATLMRSR